MGSTTDEVQGYANQAAGKVKKAVGDAVDSPKMEAEGHVQEAKGRAQVATGKVKDAVKDGIDRL